jgi:hypothetical protein
MTTSVGRISSASRSSISSASWPDSEAAGKASATLARRPTYLFSGARWHRQTKHLCLKSGGLGVASTQPFAALLCTKVKAAHEEHNRRGDSHF